MVTVPAMFAAFSFPTSFEFGLPVTAALAAVALIGYLFGQRTRRREMAKLSAQRSQELARASGIAKQLETIADALRKDLASHHGQLARFRRRLAAAQEDGDDAAWAELCSEAESILGPTMQLAQQLSMAYDSIRQQSDALETFTEARTDPLTGVGNGRALQEKLDILLTAAKRTGADFSVALLSLDRDPSATTEIDAVKKTRLIELARLVRTCMRESDFAARFGDEEFVVLMPQTKLTGASVFGDRLLGRVSDQMSQTLSCGLAEYQSNDDMKAILGRADSAFYSAKAAGGNCQFVHTGAQIREHKPASSTTADNGKTPPAATPIVAVAIGTPTTPSATV